MRIPSLLFIIPAIIFSCTAESKKKGVKPGIWRGILNVQGNELPVNFEVIQESDLRVYLINAEERIELDEVRIEGDSVFIPMHIFDTDIKALIQGDRLVGVWTKNYEKDYVVPFEAVYGTSYRFVPSKKAPESFDGTWRVTFIHHEDGDTTESVGIFSQSGTKVTGTFLNPKGDYRYLEGTVDSNTMQLSTFDGGHAFLFTAQKTTEDQLSGDFWSGSHWHETWTAVKDENAMLPDADSLTFIKEGYDGLTFSFPDLNGNPVSPEDFRGKVLIVQIFGTWCPNCMDETKFLKQWYEENHTRGVEVLGLAYEAKDDFEYARDRVLKMKEKWNIPYNFVIAGTKDKKEAAKTLPMLNHVMAFPTTIFMDRNGDVQRIHTGFTGPGTGHYYEQFVKEFNETVDELLIEDL